jgi:hypothetical protein
MEQIAGVLFYLIKKKKQGYICSKSAIFWNTNLINLDEGCIGYNVSDYYFSMSISV